MPKYTICFDTICTGYSPVMLNDDTIQFDCEETAIRELESDPEFYDDCFTCPLEDIGHKTIFYGSK